MVVTRLGSQTGIEDEPADAASFGTVPVRQRRNSKQRRGANPVDYYEERRHSSFLRRATSTALHKSVDLTKHYAALWVALAVGVLLVRQFFSDGGFSSSLTFSAGLQCFAYLLLAVKVLTQSNSDGLSVSSLAISALALSCRLYSTLFFYGYLPVDRSGDWLYQLLDVCSLVLICIIMISLFSLVGPKQSKPTTSGKGGSTPSSAGRNSAGRSAGLYRTETRGSSPPSTTRLFSLYKWSLSYWLELSIIGTALLLSFFFHPNRNNHMPSDFSWAFSFYLDSFSMIPQLLLMTQQASKGEGMVENLTSHCLASIAASNLTSLFFWWKTSRHLVSRSPNSSVGWVVLLAVVFRNLVMVDYVYHYVMAMVTGHRLTLRRWSSCAV